MQRDDIGHALVTYVLIPTVLTVVPPSSRSLGERFYDLIRELEQTRECEAEFAVVREHVQFISDLHDIQGHTLHVVKLKIGLAQHERGFRTAATFRPPVAPRPQQG
ncbi:hypothetical protein D7223_31470 [Micromonospora endolithica]|uniref:Uncharacterized protein n=1 Tax=Micromonospora endolithica TaxID=230091 RepID=A0A3A9YQM7_9ACTN|nr:hypothetical protein D7223_31470 [Micromonospora endolithica]